MKVATDCDDWQPRVNDNEKNRVNRVQVRIGNRVLMSK